MAFATRCAVTAYADEVIAGRIKTGHPVRQAAERHLRDRERGKERGLWFDEKAARFAIDFFGHLRLADGVHAGQAFQLQPFQQFIVGSLIGWKGDDGYRRFRTAYVEQAKGNGKTPTAAGLGLYALLADGEAGAEIYAAAVSRAQAGILFRDAERMVDASPALKSRVDRHVANIAHLPSGSFFRPVSSEARNLDGLRVHLALIDEVHEHRDSHVIDKLRAGTKGRRQALIFEITNSGFDKHSICWQHHEYSLKILDGILEDDSWFPYVCSLDPDDDWEDEDIWIKANPNLDVSITRRYLAEQVREAIGMPSKQNIVKRLNFCIWCVIYGTLVTMADGSQRKAEDLRPGDVILAFDEETETLVRARVGVVRDNGIQPVINVRTQRGRSTTVTSNHRFWTRQGDRRNPQDGWVEAGDLTIDSRVAVALGHRLPRGSRRMSAQVAHFLGIMVGDGTCNGSPRLTNANAGVVDFVRRFVGRLGDQLVALPDGWHYDVRHKQPSLKRTTTRRLLQKYGLWRQIDRTKRVPAAVLKGGAKVWAAFLSGYLDTDGCLTAAGLSWTSCNEPLLRDCQHMLASLGVQSTVWSGSADKHRLEVHDGIGRQQLATMLVPTHTEKAPRLAALTELAVKPLTAYGFDLVKEITHLPPQPTIGIEVEQYHTHITDGFITHNTEQATRWLDMPLWDACNGRVDADELAGRDCYAGLDLSSTSDITALLLAFPATDGTLDVLPFFWVPADSITERSRRDRVPYDVWERSGHLIPTTGNVVDYDAIRLKIGELAKRYHIRELAIDAWNSTQLQTQLQGDGISVVKFGQGFASMSAPTKELERLVKQGAIRHGGQPVLRWMASNVAVEQDAAGNIKPAKDKSSEKVDGIVALAMSIGRVMVRTQTTSVYAERGVLSFG